MTLFDAHTPSTTCETTPDPTGEDVFVFPLSFAQQRLWFLAQLEPESPAYNIPVAYRLSGPLDVSSLEQSLNEIVRRHETLRTTFHAVDGQPFQHVAPHHPLALPVVNLRDIPDGDKEARAMQLAIEDARRPFDLAQGPLFRATLAQLAEEKYVLLLNMHHIISDGWSTRVLIREITVLYRAFATGKPPALQELPIQYADFVIWQRQWLQGEVLEEQLSYWKQQLGGSPSMLELPTDRPRPPVQTYRGATQSLRLPKPLSDSLRALSQREGVTLFMTLLAAFQTLLHRYTGQDDIPVGSPIAGRNRAEIEELIGFFVSTLVLRTDLSGNPTFLELLGRARNVALGAYAHQELPFEKLVEELQPERSLSYTPLFQVFFNMMNLQDTRLTLPGLTVEPLLSHAVESKFDLTLYVREQDECIQFDLVYNADLFGQTRMVETLAQLNQLLVQIVKNPEERIQRFPLLTPTAEALLPNPAQTLRSDWVGAFHARFAQQAHRVPAHSAVVDPREVWSYAELEARSNQLAHYLCASGIQPQEVVAIYGHRSASLVWALLGVLKAGAAFLILDPAYPPARLIECLRLGKPQGWIQIGAAGVPPEDLEKVVATSSWRCRLELPHRTAVETHGLLQGYSTDDPGVMVGPDDLAYIAFTSGSTGKPKGILGGHRPISHFLDWYTQTFGLHESDRFSLLSGLSHDPLLRDLFTPLWLGGTLYIPDPDHLWSPGWLAEWLQRHKLSIVHLTPATGQLLTNATPGTLTITGEDTALRSLRFACFGGDLLTKDNVSRLRAFAPAATCVNFYGATETPQAMGYYIIPDEEAVGQSHGWTREERKEVIPLGRGIQDVQLLVLNDAQQLAGIGEVGEIYVRTPYLSKGYLDDETLTKERFIINPFTNSPEDRLYSTGDLARYRPDGNVEFLGRSDDQVKLRGFRIELAEIEVVLSQNSALREAVVIACEDTPGEKRLIAYLVPGSAQAPTTLELRRFLQTKLPDYMVPAAFVFLHALPLGPNGKVDRQALPPPSHIPPADLLGNFEAPRTPIEESLAGIWAEVLGIKHVGIHDNFFALGGHSLLAVRLFAQIEKAFGQKLPLATLFQAPTVEELASVLRQEEWSPPWSALVAIQPKGSKPPFFCVHAHGGEVLVFKDLAMHLGPDQPFYGLQALGLNGDQPHHTSIEEMAAHYLKEIRTVQPEGPYFLGGLCFGGKVAFEMAQQLYAQGQQVGLLALLDAYAPGHPQKLPWIQRQVILRVNLHVGNLRRLGPKERLNYLMEKAKIGKARAEKRLKMMACKLYLGLGRQLPRALQGVQRPTRRARRRYIPSPYPGKIILFRPSHKPGGYYHPPDMGWSGLAVGGLEIYEVPGPFGFIIREPYVRIMADGLRPCLQAAQTADGMHGEQ